jgi:hypothetical protein
MLFSRKEKDSFYTREYSKKCIQHPENALCRHMPPTAEDNIRLGLKLPRFNPQMKSKSEIRRSLVSSKRGGKTRKNKTRKTKR